MRKPGQVRSIAHCEMLLTLFEDPNNMEDFAPPASSFDFSSLLLVNDMTDFVSVRHGPPCRPGVQEQGG